MALVQGKTGTHISRPLQQGQAAREPAGSWAQGREAGVTSSGPGTSALLRGAGALSLLPHEADDVLPSHNRAEVPTDNGRVTAGAGAYSVFTVCRVAKRS